MAAITTPFLVAVIVFVLGVTALRLFQPAQGEAREMDTRIFFPLLLGPLFLALLVLLVDGLADHLYLIRWLEP